MNPWCTVHAKLFTYSPVTHGLGNPISPSPEFAPTPGLLAASMEQTKDIDLNSTFPISNNQTMEGLRMGVVIFTCDCAISHFCSVSLIQWIAYLQVVYLGLWGSTLVLQSSLLTSQFVPLKGYRGEGRLLDCHLGLWINKWDFFCTDNPNYCMCTLPAAHESGTAAP